MNDLEAIIKQITKDADKAGEEYARKKWVVGQIAVNMDGFRAGVRWLESQLVPKKKKAEDT